jgi:hypothetical protein
MVFDMKNLVGQINTALERLNEPQSLYDISKTLKTISALCHMNAKLIDQKIEEQTLEFSTCEPNIQ